MKYRPNYPGTFDDHRAGARLHGLVRALVQPATTSTPASPCSHPTRSTTAPGDSSGSNATKPSRPTTTRTPNDSDTAPEHPAPPDSSASTCPSRRHRNRDRTTPGSLTTPERALCAPGDEPSQARRTLHPEHKVGPRTPTGTPDTKRLCPVRVSQVPTTAPATGVGAVQGLINIDYSKLISQTCPHDDRSSRAGPHLQDQTRAGGGRAGGRPRCRRRGDRRLPRPERGRQDHHDADAGDPDQADRRHRHRRRVRPAPRTRSGSAAGSATCRRAAPPCPRRSPATRSSTTPGCTA